MLEKVAAIAIEESPAIARLSDEAFALLRAPIKTGVTHMGTEIEGEQMVGRVFATDKATVVQFPGHSAVQESFGNIHLLSADGAKLHLTPTQVKLELVDGTIVSQEGRVVSTKLPGGDILRQEAIKDSEVVATLNGREIERGYGIALPDGARLQNAEKHATSVFLKDGTYVGHNSYGFSLFRGVDPPSHWAGGQAPVSVESRYFRGGIPNLTLHNPRVENMFGSSFLGGNAERGLSVRSGKEWQWLKDLLK